MLPLHEFSSHHCASNMGAPSGNLLLLLINALLTSQCSLKNTDQYPRDSGPAIQDGEHFDFIVVGAGSAGSVVGSKLVQEGKWKVLILEVGGMPSVASEIPFLSLDLQKTNESTAFYTNPSKQSCLGMKNGSCHWPRAKVLGGCSTTNSMVYIRGNEKDYTSWFQNGNPGWDYETIMEHYREIERMLDPNLIKSKSYGHSGLMPLTKYSLNETVRDVILESAQEMGLKILTKDGEIGYLESPQTRLHGVRANSAKIFLGAVKNSDKLTLALNSHVTKVIIDAKKKTAEGVQVKIGERALKLYADKEVILSAGALNSPQILMLSGVGPKGHLQEHGVEVIQDLKVGHNLKDHMLFLMFSKLNEKSLKIKNHKEALDEIYNYYIHKTDVLSTVGLSNIQGFINTRNLSKFPDIQMTYLGVPKGNTFLNNTYMDIINVNTEVAQNIIEMSKRHNILMTLIILLQPKSQGKISLRSKDPSQKVEIETGYLSDSNNEDLETILRGIRFAQTQLKTESFKNLEPEVLDIGMPNCKVFKFDSDDYWRCVIRNIGTSLYHPTSTCKMGPVEDESSVVDARLRVHGIKNLRVIDASIMPNIISGNTNAPCLMIGQKGAKMIIEDYRKGNAES